MKTIDKDKIAVMSIGQIIKRLNSHLIVDYSKETIEALKERKKELRPEVTPIVKKELPIKQADKEQVRILFWQTYKSVLGLDNPIVYKSEMRILFWYLCGAVEFEKLKKDKTYDTITPLNQCNPHKGICLIGDKGLGKSKYLEAMNKTRAIYTDDATYYVPNRIESEMLSAMQIQRNCLEDQTFFKSYITRKTLIIDDLGYEDKTYGYNTLFDIIHIRYQNKKKTHISTNFTPQELTERYSGAIMDRIIEMCNIFVINREESLRK